MLCTLRAFFTPIDAPIFPSFSLLHMCTFAPGEQTWTEIAFFSIFNEESQEPFSLENCTCA